ncbi:nitrate reductase molybdenum cofactor assembly chaperone [Erythrobacter mangrovi]|uniref:Nitrate reductase molybdenum cofactor assembly chaperone n=1 Tax=Erythrobacter mangrovi TaxID=2739433 RepID=A0A7D3XAY6_9SPHN|nr:nitrate reductase molybdenum cofactor assembly chaperone [Erythrobacter mangrovi]QKG72175.1 nitrate reductase molybdenum cofactor assembly chaperone [Erythrobacter mangrovi]
MKSLHLISLLLQYPTTQLVEVLDDLRDRLAADPALPSDTIEQLAPLIARLKASDIYDAQEAYVELFDRGRAHSLHLFEHVHGESRDRGQAMVDLRRRYLEAGLDPVAKELPDYLPLFLDYCSTLPEAQARDTLAEPGLVLVALGARLAEKQSDYAPLFALLCDIAGIEMDAEAASSMPPPEDPETLEELDQQWEEEEIRFSAEAAPNPNAACPQVNAMVERMREPSLAATDRRN